MDLSTCVSEERGDEEGGGVYVTLLSYTLYPNGHGGTDTSPGVWFLNISIRYATGLFPVSPVPVKWFNGQIRPDHRSEPDMPVEMSSQGVIVDLFS